MDSSRRNDVMAVPAARYLVHFDEAEHDRGLDRQIREAIVVCETPIVEDNSAERSLEAYCRGKEEGLAIARTGFDKDLAEARHRFEEEMEVARSRWAEEVVNRLADQIPAVFH